MEHKMLWGALAVGCAGWVCLLLLGARSGENAANNPPPARSEKNPFAWLALALPVLVWLATLPVKAPFSAGQGWGRGFLLGGLVSFLCAFVVGHWGRSERSGRHLALASLFGALIVASVPLLWMRHAVIEALLGASLGWCAVSLVWLCAPQSRGDSLERGAAPSFALGLLNGAAFVTTLCAVAALGVYRDFSNPDIARGTHSAIALVIAASLALALLFGVLLNEAGKSEANPSVSSTRLFEVVTVLLCLIVPLGLGYLMATRVLDEFRVFYCLAIGATLGLLGWGLLWDASSREQENPQTPTIPPVAIVVALCAFMLAYSFLQGFGVGLMLIAAWPVSLLLWPTAAEGGTDMRARLRFDAAQTLSLLGTFLAVLLVSRVFATRYRADLRGINLVDQFALFGFLVGALVPTWLASLWFKAKTPFGSAMVSLLQFVGVGVLALLLPAAMVAIWGIKVAPAFFAGLGLSVLGWGGTAGAAASARSCAIGVFGLALSLVLTQWMIRFLPLADASRAARMHFLLWGLGGAIILVLVVDIAARLLLGLQSRSHRAAGETTPGVSS